MSSNLVYYADNLNILGRLPDSSVDLVYIDPPFNTGKTRVRKTTKAVQSLGGSHAGFGGKSYEMFDVGEAFSYDDIYQDQYLFFLKLRVQHIHRVLKDTGSFYLHLDYRESHYAKVLVDSIFGRDNFLNEIIWAYDFGAKTKKRWPSKHNNILVWEKKKGNSVFNVEGIDRIPYMAPGLVGAEKAAKGKLPTDCWWHTIVATNGKEKTGYPTQKPLGILKRIVAAASPPGGVVLDCFAGSGTTGAATLEVGGDRSFILVDENPSSIKVMRKRFKPYIADGASISYLKSRKTRINTKANE